MTRKPTAGIPWEHSRVPTKCHSRARGISLSTAFERQRRRRLQRLINHAVALRQFLERLELLGRGVSVQLEAQADGLEADGRVLGDTERAAEVQIALRRDRAATHRDGES